MFYFNVNVQNYVTFIFLFYNINRIVNKVVKIPISMDK